MIRFIKYIAVFLLGFLIAKFWYEDKQENHQKEQIQVVVEQVKNQSKLVVSKAVFSEIYNYRDSKKYFFESISFDKKAIVAVNVTVEVGYDLSKLEIQVDSIGKQIIINRIPEQEINISPDVKFFDFQQSQFNTFSKDDLNRINKKSIDKIKDNIEFSAVKTKAKERLFVELSKIYQLSVLYGWAVVDNTNANLDNYFLKEL